MTADSAKPAGEEESISGIWQSVVTDTFNPLPASAPSEGDEECALTVWWTHNKSKFTTTRQAARAAWKERACRAAATKPEPASEVHEPSRKLGFEQGQRYEAERRAEPASAPSEGETS